MRPRLLLGSLGLAAAIVAHDVTRRAPVPEPAHESAAHADWRDTTLADPVARLQARLDAGVATLPHDSAFGYLPALLRTLGIPLSSQGLVFSRTSLQTDRITPWSPRALYFNDDVYIGYVQESHFLEIASMHPTRGAVFYTLTQDATEKPAFERETRTCLMCHQSRATTGGVPGLMVLSSITDKYGYPITGVHDGGMTDATPIRQRWGGWYVTGTHGTGTTGAAGHSGNVYSPLFRHEIPDKQRYRTELDLTVESDRTHLEGKFDPSPYPSAHSDIVALMVLVHQTTVHNLLAGLHEIAEVTPPSVADAGAGESAEATRLNGAVERLLRAMLFVQEAPLAGPMRGTTSFAQDFASLGPRDARGRSLRDFDLERRLFRHPLSFLIYSESFDALPEVAERVFYQRLDAILRGEEQDAAYAHLTAADRTAIREILEATKPAFVRARQTPG
jgi:hypothetical protein